VIGKGGQARRHPVADPGPASGPGGHPAAAPPGRWRGASFRTTGLVAGIGIRDMQYAMRHADPGTTLRYAAHAVAAYLAGMSTGRNHRPRSTSRSRRYRARVHAHA
jgi:hypothetical protein